MQKKISISLESNLLNKIDEMIKKGRIKKRSQVVEHIIKNFFKDQIVKQAVILAGGKSLKINKTEFNQTIKKLVENNVEEIFIITNIDNWTWIKPEFTEIKIIKEDHAMGTAGALTLVENKLISRFFVILGDISFNLDMSDMISFHKSSDNIATIGITTTEKNLSTDLIRLEGNKIREFSYKIPLKEKSFLTNSGIYLFEKEIFKFIKKDWSLETDVFPKLVEKEELNGFVFSGQWRHIKDGR